MLMGVVVGGLNRPIPATLGGFSIGFAFGLLGGILPTNQSQYLPSFIFAAVIVVLLLRPDGLFTRATRGGGAGMSQVRRIPELLAPLLLILATAWLGPRGLDLPPGVLPRHARQGRDRHRPVRLHRQLGRPLVRGRSASSLSARGRPEFSRCPPSQKRFTMPGLAHFLVTTTVGNVVSLALAAAVGAAAALVVGLPLMRLSGLAAGIATFAVLGITYNVLTYEQKIGPGLNAFSGVPQTTGIWQAAIGGLICATAAYVYQRTRFGRMLRATREDPVAATARDLDLPAAAARLHALRCSRGLRRRDLRPPAAAAGEGRVPRPHLHHARDARRGRRRGACSARSSARWR